MGVPGHTSELAAPTHTRAPLHLPCLSPWGLGSGLWGVQHRAPVATTQASGFSESFQCLHLCPRVPVSW